MVVAVRPDAFLLACPSRGLVARLGEKWALLLIVALGEGPSRFGALRRRIEGVSQKMLTQSLRSLQRDGLVSRRVEAAGPLAVEYRLTPLGLGLLPLARELKGWAEREWPRIEAANLQYDEDQGRRAAPPANPAARARTAS